MCKLSEFDEKMLKALAQMETGLVADRLDIKPEVIYQRLYRIRKHRREAQLYVNKLNGYERMSERLRRMLIPTKSTPNPES